MRHRARQRRVLGARHADGPIQHPLLDDPAYPPGCTKRTSSMAGRLYQWNTRTTSTVTCDASGIAECVCGVATVYVEMATHATCADAGLVSIADAAECSAAAAELQRTYQFTFGASTGNAPTTPRVLHPLLRRGYPVYQGNNYKAYYITGSDAYRSTCDSTTDRTATCLCKLPPSPPPPSPPPPCQAYAHGRNRAQRQQLRHHRRHGVQDVDQGVVRGGLLRRGLALPRGVHAGDRGRLQRAHEPAEQRGRLCLDQACTGYEWSTTAQYGRCIPSGYDFESDPSIIGTYSNYELPSRASATSAATVARRRCPTTLCSSCNSRRPPPARLRPACTQAPSAFDRTEVPPTYATYGGYTYQPVGLTRCCRPAAPSAGRRHRAVNLLTDDDPRLWREHRLGVPVQSHAAGDVTAAVRVWVLAFHIFHDALLGGGREIRPSPNGAASIRCNRAFVLNAPTDGELSSRLGAWRSHQHTDSASAQRPHHWSLAWPLEDGGNGRLGDGP